MTRKRDNSRFALASRKLKISTRAREEHEDGRAEVRDPTCEEQSNVRARRIGRIKLEDGVMNEVARMVQHHDYHHDAAQQVDGVYAPGVRMADRADSSQQESDL